MKVSHDRQSHSDASAIAANLQDAIKRRSAVLTAHVKNSFVPFAQSLSE